MRNSLREKPRRAVRKRSLLPRQYSLVRYVSPVRRPFRDGQVFIFFGEILNMPGHCIVADHKTGKLYSGYHIERFMQIPDDET